MGDPSPCSLEGAPEPCTEVSSCPALLGGDIASHLWKRGCSPFTVREGKPTAPETPRLPGGGWGLLRPAPEAGQGALAGVA